ncbi:uncharacterized protein LOC110384196 isoform X1 [Helicoverpa armigera]|uniref:uncharacterized protein LOC110384196 isoform X1 n=1 Tax=Helicoverpa armigera TaxID=29058 RepID=UPI000DAB1387|nr:hypothetical protein B5X24_HaOG201885 [Helicoverpa armigera]
MLRISVCFSMFLVLNSLIRRCHCVVYTYEDIELRRIFPSEFPQDTVRKSGSADPEHLGRFAELKSYFKYPKAKVNAHFEELICYEKNDKKEPLTAVMMLTSSTGTRLNLLMCRIDVDRYSPEEDMYYMSPAADSHVDRRRVYCFMLLCFTEDELDRVVASF